MGILNITPDSFSDGGKFLKVEKALEHFNYLSSSGSNIVEIGAESSKPGANLIDATEEWERLEKVLVTIHPRHQKVCISIDTRKAEIAQKVLQMGVSIINDVSALSDPRLAEVVAQFPASHLVLNHNRGIPPSLINPPTNHNLISEVIEFFEEKIQLAHKMGVKKNQLILDPGLGFGKGLEENIILLHSLNELKIHFQLPVMIGLSRKRFVAELWGETHKDVGSVALGLLAVTNGANIIRCHEPKLHKPLSRVRFMPNIN